MTKYRVHFINNGTFDITPEEFQILNDKIVAGSPQWQFFTTYSEPVRQFGLNLQQITHIDQIDISEAAAVVTPKSPQELQQDKLIASENKARDVDTLLEEAKEHQRETVG